MFSTDFLYINRLHILSHANVAFYLERKNPILTKLSNVFELPLSARNKK